MSRVIGWGFPTLVGAWIDGRYVCALDGDRSDLVKLLLFYLNYEFCGLRVAHVF